MVYVSRFSNPALRTGNYTAVRISLSAPKWPLGYDITGSINELIPFGLLHGFTKEQFVAKYRERLNRYGVNRIRNALKPFLNIGKPVVLLCYEDVRVEGQTCHRTTFAEWWQEKTGEVIEELPDQSASKWTAIKVKEREPENVQISMFGNGIW